ncbi:MAG: hypothetical protein ACRDOA_22040, partial [Streptosporangiaceae bacterium]
AGSYRAMHDAYRQHETVFAGAMADRTEWERTTRQERQLAVAADAELRRRHPSQPWPPLRSAEPEPIAQPQPCDKAIAPATDVEQIARQATDLAARHREFTATLAERQSLMINLEEPGHQALSRGLPAWAQPGRDAILQPPKPLIRPSARILEHIAGRDPGLEAGN